MRVKLISEAEPEKFAKALSEFLSEHDGDIIEEFYFSSSFGMVNQSAFIKDVGAAKSQLNIVTVYSCIFHYEIEEKKKKASSKSE